MCGVLLVMQLPLHLRNLEDDGNNTLSSESFSTVFAKASPLQTDATHRLSRPYFMHGTAYVLQNKDKEVNAVDKDRIY